MAIVTMQKVAILVHNASKEAILSALHDLGVLQVEEREGAPDFDHTEVDFRRAELHFAVSVLKEHASKDTQIVAGKAATSEEIVHAVHHTDIRGIIDRLHELEKSDTEAERRIQELTTLIETLTPWRALQSPLSSARKTETSVRLFGEAPLAHAQTLRSLCEHGELARCNVEQIGQRSGAGTFEAVVWKKDRDMFEEKATALGWTSLELPTEDATTAAALEESIAEKKELAALRDRNDKERDKLSIELPNLVKAEIFMRWLSQKQTVREACAETEDTATLLGWMPKDKLEEVEQALSKVSPAIAILKVKADEGEEPPVLLKNPKLVTPFESVTNLYGLPLNSDIDPTMSLSPFFILYFALCLTDAGYGLILAIIFGTVLLKTRKSIEEAKLIWLLFFGGVVTFLVSILFGGWFGFTPEQVPGVFTKETAAGLMFRGQVWDLTDTSGITFLQNLSLVLGLTHLFFGMFLAGWHKWVHGKRAEALWSDFTSHLLLGAAIFFAVSSPDTKQIAQYILYGTIAAMVWGKGYGSVWYLRPLMGLLGVMNFCLGMISNVLSYLRLLALGLVTGALAAAVNQVAVEMSKLFPMWLAIPVMILIFLLGHTVSIALNTLGSFIHSGRLQFIEFFSQFFEGGGRGFTPFKRSTS